MPIHQDKRRRPALLSREAGKHVWVLLVFLVGLALPTAALLNDPSLTQWFSPQNVVLDRTDGLLTPLPSGERGRWSPVVATTVALATTVAVVSVSHALSGFAFAGRGFAFWCIVGSYLVTAAWGSMSWVAMRDKPSWVAAPHGWLVFFAAWTLIATLSFRSVPRRLHEMAAVDGAGPLSRFWVVVWPYQRLLITLILAVAVGTALAPSSSWRVYVLINGSAMVGAFLLIHRPTAPDGRR